MQCRATLVKEYVLVFEMYPGFGSMNPRTHCVVEGTLGHGRMTQGGSLLARAHVEAFFPKETIPGEL